MGEDRSVSESGSTPTRALDEMDPRILARLADYCRYLYEEEKKRTERLEGKVNLFLVALGGSIIGASLKLPMVEMPETTNLHLAVRILWVMLLSALFILLFLSSVFTYLTYRVRQFERPSDPRRAVAKAASMQSEAEFLAATTADYAIAAHRNHEINDKKAGHLSWALLFLLGALLTYIATALLMNICI